MECKVECKVECNQDKEPETHLNTLVGQRPRADLSAYGKFRTWPGGEAFMQGRFPLSEVSAFYCRCFAERVPEGMTFHQKWSQNGLKWSRKGAKSDQNGARREPKRAKGPKKDPLRKSTDF